MTCFCKSSKTGWTAPGHKMFQIVFSDFFPFNTRMPKGVILTPCRYVCSHSFHKSRDSNRIFGDFYSFSDLITTFIKTLPWIFFPPQNWNFASNARGSHFDSFSIILRIAFQFPVFLARYFIADRETSIVASSSWHSCWIVSACLRLKYFDQGPKCNYLRKWFFWPDKWWL